MNKLDWIKAHAKQRAEERYGLKLNRHIKKDIIALIRANKPNAEFRSHRLANHIIEYQGVTYKIGYDKKRKEIVTFLPLEPKKKKVVG